MDAPFDDSSGHLEAIRKDSGSLLGRWEGHVSEAVSFARLHLARVPNSFGGRLLLWLGNRPSFFLGPLWWPSKSECTIL